MKHYVDMDAELVQASGRKARTLNQYLTSVLRSQTYLVPFRNCYASREVSKSTKQLNAQFDADLTDSVNRFTATSSTGTSGV